MVQVEVEFVGGPFDGEKRVLPEFSYEYKVPMLGRDRNRNEFRYALIYRRIPGRKLVFNDYEVG